MPVLEPQTRVSSRRAFAEAHPPRSERHLWKSVFGASADLAADRPQPWTASATSRQQSEQDKAQKLGLIRLLRNDLEKVRMLTELVRKREKKKLERAKHLKAVVEEMLFPKEGAMRKVLQSVKRCVVTHALSQVLFISQLVPGSLDKTAYFSQPVSREDVPDYYEIIKFPMDWATMSAKLDRHEYPLALDFSVSPGSFVSPPLDKRLIRLARTGRHPPRHQ